MTFTHTSGEASSCGRAGSVHRRQSVAKKNAPANRGEATLTRNGLTVDLDAKALTLCRLGPRNALVSADRDVDRIPPPA